MDIIKLSVCVENAYNRTYISVRDDDDDKVDENNDWYEHELDHLPMRGISD